MAPVYGDVPVAPRSRKRRERVRGDEYAEHLAEYLDFPDEVRTLRRQPPAECNTHCRELASQLLGEFGNRLTEWEIGLWMSITVSQLHPFTPKQIDRLLCIRHEVPHRPLTASTAPPAA